MISHNDADPNGNLEDSFNRQNSGNNLLGDSAISKMTEDQIALHDSANNPLGTTAPTMTQSQQQTPLPLHYMGRAVDNSNFGIEFDSMALNGDEPEEKRSHFRGVAITGPITYT